MATVKLGIDGLPATGLVARAQHIHDEMDGKPEFTTPLPTQVAFQGAIDTLNAANAAVENGGKSEYEARDNAWKTLEDMMRQRAAYVQGVSNGDAAIIKLSGFGVRKPGQPIGQLERPAKLVMVPSKTANSVSMRWAPTRGADTYQVFISRVGTPFAWEPVGFTNKARFSMGGITRGTIVWFAVLAIGTAGPTSLSEPLEAMGSF